MQSRNTHRQGHKGPAVMAEDLRTGQHTWVSTRGPSLKGELLWGWDCQGGSLTGHWLMDNRAAHWRARHPHSRDASPLEKGLDVPRRDRVDTSKEGEMERSPGDKAGPGLCGMGGGKARHQSHIAEIAKTRGWDAAVLGQHQHHMLLPSPSLMSFG